MNCARCDRPLTAGRCDVITNPGASGPGADIYVCRSSCKRKPRQTAPEPAVVLAPISKPRYRSVRRSGR